MTLEQQIADLNAATADLTHEVLATKAQADSAANAAKADADRALTARQQISDQLTRIQAARQEAQAAAAQVESIKNGDEDYVIPAMTTLLSQYSNVVATAVSDEIWAENAHRWDAPRRVLAVAEKSKVTLHDLTRPDLPVWWSAAQKNHRTVLGYAGRSIKSVQLAGSYLLVGNSDSGAKADYWSGLGIIDFATGELIKYGHPAVAGTLNTSLDQIADNAEISRAFSASIVSRRVNGIAAFIANDAPVNPLSGLPVPCIAVATNSGVSELVAEHDGWSVRNITDYATDVTIMATAVEYLEDELHVAFYTSPNARGGVAVYRNGVWQRAYSHLPKGANHVHAGTTYDWSFRNDRPVMPDGIAGALVTSQWHNGAWNDGPVVIRHDNAVAPAAGMRAVVAKDYATPWMPGDVQFVGLCDGLEGVVSGGELIKNGDFSAGLDSWTADLNGGSVTPRVDGGVRLEKSSLSTANTVVSQMITVPDGETWKLCIPLEAARKGGVMKVELDKVLIQKYTSALKNYYLDIVGDGNPKSLRIIGGGPPADGVGVDVGEVSLFRAIEDHSGKHHHARVRGSLNVVRPAGSDISVVSGFRDRAAKSPLNCIEHKIRVRDALSVTMLLKNGGDKPYDIPLHIIGGWNGAASGRFSTYLKLQNDNVGQIRAIAYTDEKKVRIITGPACTDFVAVTAVLSANRIALYANGKQVGEHMGPTRALPEEELTCLIGTGLDSSGKANWNGEIGPVVIGHTIPSDDQIRDIHRDMLAKIKQPSLLNAPVVAVGYDHCRDDNYVVCNDRKLHRLTRKGTTIEQTVDVPAEVGTVKSLTVRDGEVVVGGSAGVWISQPAQNLRAPVITEDFIEQPFELGEGDGSATLFWLPYGWKPKQVFVDGRLMCRSAQDAWAPVFDGYKYGVRFVTAPGPIDIDCDAVRA